MAISSPLLYRITASALNLRAAPSKTASKIAVLSQGDQVISTGEPVSADGWLSVVWQGQRGYVASAFISPVTQNMSAPALPPVSLPAPDVDHRDVDPLKLHPTVRSAVADLLQELNGEGIPFRLFEAFRSPERQSWLYAQGRTRSGGIVTKAQAWESYHQYGLAVDLVLFRNNQWSWSTAGNDANLWKRMHTIAETKGLRPLSFEAPHVEFAGPKWSDLQKGQGFPENGDNTWLDTVTQAAVRWRAVGGAPAAPPLQLPERPPLTTDQP